MTELITHLAASIRPDASRTVIRPFSVGDPVGYVGQTPRVQRVIARVMSMSDSQIEDEIATTMASLDDRHPNVSMRLLRRFEEMDGVAERTDASPNQALLIGGYFSEEYAFASAALFNPSVVEHPDQSGLAPGDTRVLMALRGIGEGHVSSLTFRTGVWAADGDLTLDEPSSRAVGPRVNPPTETKRTAELTFDEGIPICEEVVFPFLPSQGRGIEDVRLCRFQEDEGSLSYRGTFTAFSGSETRQAVLKTADFRSMVFRGLDGDLFATKGMAWFPRKIDGRWMMLGRQDNESVWLCASDEEHTWSGGRKLLEPRYPWEFIQTGNCGSPMEIEEGWLVLTHGVGVVRNYSIGACLLDKKDPSKVLARMAEPLLAPSDTERDGYVPNVVYSCGGLVRGRTLLLPYGVADDFTAFSTVDVALLLAAMS